MPVELTRVRIDKWLWAARFFKTRSQASEAVLGGRAHVNGVRAKPSKDVAVGDVVELTVGQLQWTLTVRALADRRGSATVAQRLYEEGEASRGARELRVAQLRMAQTPGANLGARPTKRDRRQIERINRFETID
jgi:ribosome-associated heat shock protein Hsp15